MPDFSVRSTREEIMDDPHAPEVGIRQNLKELEVVNKLLGGYNVVIDSLSRLEWPLERPLSIMDIGSGGGDTLRAIARWADRNSKAVDLHGVDMNPVMIAYATEHSTAFPGIHFHLHNVFDSELDHRRADIVTCSLFCHHFPHALLVKLIQRMHYMATRAVVINDLHRHWFAYYSIRTLTRIFSRSFMVKNDGPLSVARAFIRSDWEKVLSEAGIRNYTLKWRWAWRWQLVIEKEQSHEA